MKKYPSDIHFKYPWRKYQQRVLTELEDHLDDNHLHIIAPPGSGKTVLGLEVALRLNKPTLILAPTVAIRNQWIQRFCELFLQVSHKPDWISRDIKKPQFLTVATYQALHAACSGVGGSLEKNEVKSSKKTNDNTQHIIKLLQAQNIGTIVVDEAHHLKNAWWQSLTKVKKELNPTIVGLTATPPYDVSYGEWQRYIDLNGPVDAEISVPELVIEGDLCPHQDYVFFSQPTLEEESKISEYRQRIQALFNDIKADAKLKDALVQHPIFAQPNQHLEWIYTNLECYSATLIYLHAVGVEIGKEHLDVIGEADLNVPALSLEWMEILLSFYLFKDAGHFKPYEEHQEKLLNKLKRNGVLERRTISLRHNPKINRFLSSSINKLKSIDKIVEFEHQHLKQELRMVILTDYIRKEFLIERPENHLELNKMGVMPIFELLRRHHRENIKIGVLTGSLVIIPLTALEAFQQVSAQYKINEVSTKPLAFDEHYLMISSTEQLKHDIVHIITQVFQKGHIEILIGTKSLLGEGWDAPSINSLILASFVGSYVLSNQMRGRAIRTERLNSEKTGNIWHLVCLDPTASDGGDDMVIMQRRFKAFVGVSFKEKAGIENGISRLDLAHPLTTAELDEVNQRMLSYAGQRDLLKKRWRDALEEGTSLIEEVKVPFPEEKNYKAIKSLYYNKTIKYLMGMLGSGLLAFSFEVLQAMGRMSRHIRTFEDLLYLLLFIGGIGMLFFGRLAYKTGRAYIKYRDISEDIQQIGHALLASLIKIGAIQTDYTKLEVIAQVDEYGSIYCHLEGGTAYEKSTFIKSLQEVIEKVDNPRYIIIRKSHFLRLVSQKDYHSVPDMVGRKKHYAEYFEKQWSQLVGTCELVYTRTLEGRKILLKSRINSLASEFEEKTERVNKWR